jgi:Domain of Unknown Function (DUF1080)
VVRPDDWNEYLLKVEGNRYIARLNGVQMVDYTDPKPFGADGGIALQLHSGGHGNMRFQRYPHSRFDQARLSTHDHSR